MITPFFCVLGASICVGEWSNYMRLAYPHQFPKYLVKKRKYLSPLVQCSDCIQPRARIEGIQEYTKYSASFPEMVYLVSCLATHETDISVVIMSQVNYPNSENK